MLLIHCRPQTSDGLLKLPVLGGVDKRVDTAVNERQHYIEVVVPGCVVDRVADVTEQEQDFRRCPADGKSTADRQRRDKCIASGFVYH